MVEGTRESTCGAQKPGEAATLQWLSKLCDPMSGQRGGQREKVAELTPGPEPHWPQRVSEQGGRGSRQLTLQGKGPGCW